MTVKLTCDVCKNDVPSLDKIGEITKEYQVADRIVHICKGCARKLDQKLVSLRDYYAKLLAQDTRLL